MAKTYEKILVWTSCPECAGMSVVRKGHISKMKTKKCPVCINSPGEVQKTELVEVK